MAQLAFGEVRGASKIVAATPTITAGSYSAGFVIGGIIPFNNIMRASLDNDNPSWSAVLESLTIRFKGSVQNTELDFCLFDTSPSNGTYADHASPTWSASDDAFFHGAYALTSNLSPLGTHTIYNLDGIGKVIVGASANLYGIVVSKSNLANSPASTTDMTVQVGVLW